MDDFKLPMIEIQFGNYQQTVEEIGRIYIKTLSDAVRASRYDMAMLIKLNHLGKELAWMTDAAMFELKNPERPLDVKETI
jgi:hypothetical protein